MTSRPHHKHLVGCLLLLVWLAASAAFAQDGGDPLAAALSGLPTAGYADKEQIATTLAGSGHPRARAVLAAMLEDRLLATADGKVVIAESVDDALTDLTITDAASGAKAGTVPRDGLTKIGTNNRLRKALRGTLARFDLASPDRGIRLNAVNELLRSMDDVALGIMRERATIETDPDVKTAIGVGLAFGDLDSGDHAARLAAVKTLGARRSQEVRNRLALIVEKNADGTPVEQDAEVLAAAETAVAAIDSTRALYGGVQTLFFGLSLGSVLVLVAIGLAITFGVMGVINMAHGELMMLGAYTTYVVQTLMPNHLGASIIVAIPAAFVVSGLTGILIERSIIRFLYGRPLETLLATFGLSLILQQTVRSIFTALNRSVATPPWLSGTWQVNEALSLTYNRLYIVLFTLVVFAILLVVLKHTSLGLRIRAVAQNRGMARAMGVRSQWVDAMTFGLGSGIAGVAGVALSQLTNVGPNLGQTYIIDSFMVVVFGGVGNLWGTLIGGMSLGVVNKLLEPYAGAVLAKIVVLVGLILFIQRRPRGLFPPTGRAAEGH